MFKDDLFIRGNMVTEFIIDNLSSEIKIVAHEQGVFKSGQPNIITAGNQKLLQKKYIINKNATILFWDDGTKTVVKRSQNDEYNKILGFLWAYFHKTSGLSKTKANKYIKGLLDEDELSALGVFKDINISDLFGDIAEGISKEFQSLSKSFRNNSNKTNITIPNLIDKNNKKYNK